LFTGAAVEDDNHSSEDRRGSGRRLYECSQRATREGDYFASGTSRTTSLRAASR
jgi:hypothetical protein